VIAGKYEFTVWLEERLTGQGRPEEIGAYYGTVEVPPMTAAYMDEPLDLGNLTLGMHKPPLHVGDMAPLFETKTLDGKDIRLADYRGKFVLLSFWQPQSHPELDRLKELHKTYGSTGKLQIIGLGGSDTLAEVERYVAEHQIEWPEIYSGEKWDEGIAGQYGLPGLPYILLIDPEGKIVATWLRGEKLTQTLKDALDKTD
jgi:peroxiredoxin